MQSTQTLAEFAHRQHAVAVAVQSTKNLFVSGRAVPSFNAVSGSVK
jgi:hypothetical protein